MRRLFWVALGATAGVLIVRRLTKVANSLTPEGAAERVSDRVGGLTQAVREFTAEVREAMAERDAELRDALGITGSDDARETNLDAVHDLFRHDHPKGG